MKISRLTSYILAGSLLLCTTACLKDQKELFPESSTVRLQEYIDQAHTLLTSSEGGWIMEYYPGAGQALGGYAFHLSFNENGEVSAMSELDPEKECKSLYKLTADNGAVLSFDTYNPVLHYFATPSSTEYQAMGGDFEFTIISVSAEKIGLRGKRSGNRYDLYPFSGDDAAAYLEQVSEMSSKMRASILSGEIDFTPVRGNIDFNNRRIYFEYDDVTLPTNPEDEPVIETYKLEVPFMYTPKGLKAYGEFEIAGVWMDSFVYDAVENTLSCGDVVLQGSLPKDYTDYADFAGNYSLTFVYSGTTYAMDVTLKTDESGKNYMLGGLFKNHDVKMVYDMARGRLLVNSQVMGANGANTVWLAGCSLASGGVFSMDTKCGMELVRNLKTGRFDFVDNGKSSLVVDSFVLWETTSSGASVGQFEGWGNSIIPYVQSLVRK